MRATVKIDAVDYIIQNDDGTRWALVPLEKLRQIEDLPTFEGMKWLEKKTGMSTKTIIKNILIPFESELNALYGGPVAYAQGRGTEWRFHRERMAQWLEDNGIKVLKDV